MQPTPTESSASNNYEKNQLNEIKNILESKLTKLEERIDSVGKKITKQHKEFISSTTKVEESVKLSLDVGQSNFTKFSKNTDRIENNTCEID